MIQDLSLHLTMTANETIANIELLKAEVPRLLKDELILKDLTPAWAARRMGVRKQFVQSVFAGKEPASLKLALKMKDLLTQLSSVRLSA